MRRLPRLLLFAAVSIAALLLLACSSWSVPRPRRFLHRAALQAAWGRAVRMILGLRVAVRGRPPGEDGLLFVSNHLGYLDVPVLAGMLPVSFVAKSEVARWPLLGAMARAAGALFIARHDRRRLKDFVAEASGRLRSGESLPVFPEGTSSRGETVPPFGSAAFGAVEGAACAAVVPVAIELRLIDGREAVGELRDLACRHGDMSFLPHFIRFAGLRGASYEVTVGARIPCAGRDRKALAAFARDEVVSLKSGAAGRRTAPRTTPGECGESTRRQTLCGGQP